MVDTNLVTAKLADLVDRIERVRSHIKSTADELARERDALDLVSFNLMLSVQSCLDIASHIIADMGWRPATTLAGSFEHLRDHGVITARTAAALGRAAGLRNVVAHGYAGADPEKIHAASTSGLADLESFASEIAAWLGGDPVS